MKTELEFAKHVMGCQDCRGGRLCGKGLKLVSTMQMPAGGSQAIARDSFAAGEPMLVVPEVGDEFDIQWMPPGKQSPNCFVNGKSRKLNFTVQAKHAELFNAVLQLHRSMAAAGDGDVPYFDFNHEDGARSGEPTEFYWAGDDPKRGGIRAKGKWSGSGKQALINRDYRRFSPEWVFDPKTEEPVWIGVNLGGLVNKAAFRGIQAVVAKDAESAQETNDGDIAMDGLTREDFTRLLADGLKPFTDRLSALETAAAKAATGTEQTQAATAQASAADDKIVKLFDDRLKPLMAKLTEFETASLNAVKAQAKAGLQPHIARGAIGPADTKSIEFWENALVANAAAAGEQLARLPGKTLTRMTTSNGGTTTTTMAGEPEELFIAKAKDFGKAHNCANDAEALIAFGRTAEGAALYQAFREKLPVVTPK